MSARRVLFAALTLLAGCNATSARPGLQLNGPSAVAVFRGLTTRDAANLRTYVAVANERGNDLRILDAVDGKAVLAPGLIMSLSVPTASRPALLAAGGLHDGAKADLLVVASTGLVACDATAPTVLSGCIQVVDTWEPATALKTGLSIDLGLLAPGLDAQILSLAVVPVPEASGSGWQAASGQARVVAGLSGGRLLVADFARAADGVAITRTGAAVHDLGFDPRSLSASPDLVHLYAASTDPIGGVEGVAELDLSGALGAPPPVRAIPAGAPTTHVLAARLRPFVGLTSTSNLDAHGPEVLRLYAALDPLRCGRLEAQACGLAVLDPVAGGPLSDPAGELPAHAPIAVPGTILGLTAVYPPAVGAVDASGNDPPSGTPGILQKQATAAGFRYVSTLAAVASTTGAVYLVDLARGALVLDRDVLATSSGGTQARVQGAAATTPTTANHPYLALWDERPVTTTPALTRDATVLPLLIAMTPGYTPSETWTVAWEGELPDLAGLKAQLQSSPGGGGLDWLAVQSSSGADAASGPYRGVGRLYDPRLAIHPGDIVSVTPADLVACPDGVFELEVTGFLPPSADHPGGAVTVVARPDALQPAVVVDGVETRGKPHCLDHAGRSIARVTFRSSGLLLTGATFGYAGRPVPQVGAAGAGFTLGWQDPTALSCPMMDDPAWPPATCNQDCRDQCERLLLSRKARREFYVAEQCLAIDAPCVERWGQAAFLDRPGPVLAFKAGWQYAATATTQLGPTRGVVLSISTSSGQSLALRRPLSGSTPTAAVLPTGMATFDRTGTTGLAADGVRVLTAYPGNLVLDFSPSQPATAATIHR